MTFQAFEDHTQWKAVKEVCHTLKEAGYQALLAGGCVRDLLMRRKPNDFDIASDATPDQVEALFPRALTVGKAFGVTILPFDGFQIEVATFREDLEYVDGRRPEGVKFSTAKADAQRRDFTVNALFYDLDTNAVVDYVDGQKDIAAGVLRTVGRPELRFEEDKLRILRAIRFAAQLNFSIEPQTLQAVKDLAPEVAVVSKERIRDELVKLLKSPGRDVGLRLLLETRVMESAFSEIASSIREDESMWLKRFEIAKNLEAMGTIEGDFDLLLYLALFLYPALEPLSQSNSAASDHAAEVSNEKHLRERVLKSLKLENQVVDQLVSLFKGLNLALKPSSVRFGTLAVLLSKPGAKTLLKLAHVIESSAEKSFESTRSAVLDRAVKVTSSPSGEKVLPLLTGQDLKALGLTPGPKMGELLNEAYLLQLEGTLRTKDEALLWVKGK